MNVDELLRSAELPNVAVSTEAALERTVRRGRARRHRRRAFAGVAMALLLIGVATTATLVARDNSQRLATEGADEVEHLPGSASTTVPATLDPSTTAVVSSSTPGDETDPDEAAAVAFIDAWRRGDAEAMRQLGAADQVDVAMSFGTADGEPDCTSQPSGQYECVVSVSSGTRMYLLIGEPGDRAGRVWWVAEYVPGT